MAIINPFKVAGFESKEWLRSSEIKEDGLHFVLRRNEVRKVNVAIINPFKVAGFESKERLRSSEIKRVNMAIINPFKVAGFESKERLRSSEIKERQCGDHQPIQSRWF